MIYMRVNIKGIPRVVDIQPKPSGKNVYTQTGTSTCTRTRIPSRRSSDEEIGHRYDVPKNFRCCDLGWKRRHQRQSTPINIQSPVLIAIHVCIIKKLFC